jgi:hypothetical protein
VASTKSGCDHLEIGSTKKLPGLIPKNGPISLVAAEIHLGRGQLASATAGCAATFKLRATAKKIKYRATSKGYKESEGTLKQDSLPD